MIKAGIYKALLFFYSIMPFKREFCRVLRWVGMPNDKFYTDLKFTGKFKVKMDEDRFFYLYHTGGTIENETFWKGLFVSSDHDTGWIWLQLCSFSDVIFDIGANTGIYSMTAKCINPRSTVYSFEPSVSTYEKLKRNNDINGYDVHCESIALSDKSGEYTFYDIKYAHQTSASLSSERFGNDQTEKLEYTVKTMTMSDFIRTNNIGKIDLIKIDIEMYEPEAIEGLGQYLEKFKPIIIIEVLTEKVAEKLNRLIGEDYIKIHLLDVNKIKKVDKFTPVPELYNYLVFHKDLTETIKRKTTLQW